MTVRRRPANAGATTASPSSSFRRAAKPDGVPKPRLAIKGTERNHRRKVKANGSRIGALSQARKAYEDGASCGDWLAVALHDHCYGEDGFDIGKFEKVLRENKIDWDLDRSKPGWQGRFRMNGRQKLAAVARKTGYVSVSGEKVRAPGAKRGRKTKTAPAK